MIRFSQQIHFVLIIVVASPGASGHIHASVDDLVCWSIGHHVFCVIVGHCGHCSPMETFLLIDQSRCGCGSFLCLQTMAHILHLFQSGRNSCSFVHNWCLSRPMHFLFSSTPDAFGFVDTCVFSSSVGVAAACRCFCLWLEVSWFRVAIKFELSSVVVSWWIWHVR